MTHSGQRAGAEPAAIVGAHRRFGGIAFVAMVIGAVVVSLSVFGERRPRSTLAPRAQEHATVLSTSAPPEAVAQRLWRSASPQADLEDRIDAMTTQARDRGTSVRGADTDRDGVRDDIQRYIGQTWSDQTQRAAVQRYAAHQQALLETASRAAARERMGLLLRSLECLGRLSGNEGLMRSKDVLAMTLNTPQRRQAYDRAMARVAGALFFESAGDPCA